MLVDFQNFELESNLYQPAHSTVCSIEAKCEEVVVSHLEITADFLISAKNGEL